MINRLISNTYVIRTALPTKYGHIIFTKVILNLYIDLLNVNLS